MMKVEATKEHAWLQQLVGEWTYEHPPESRGTESVRMLGDVWVLCEGRGTMPDGSPATTLMTLGYDPQKQRFVGTFIGSMMTYLWLYEGTLDAEGRVLTLSAEGPSFSTPGAMDRYEDSIEIVSPDERVLRSQVVQADGTRQEFMVARYRRV